MVAIPSWRGDPLGTLFRKKRMTRGKEYSFYIICELNIGDIQNSCDGMKSYRTITNKRK